MEGGSRASADEDMSARPAYARQRHASLFGSEIVTLVRSGVAGFFPKVWNFREPHRQYCVWDELRLAVVLTSSGVRAKWSRLPGLCGKSACSFSR
jgi:hypothetical protein